MAHHEDRDPHEAEVQESSEASADFESAELADEELEQVAGGLPGSPLAGTGFIVGSVTKFHLHDDDPTQLPHLRRNRS